jgi:hypothetical protein
VLLFIAMPNKHTLQQVRKCWFIRLLIIQIPHKSNRDLAFFTMGQPLETQVCVFVDPQQKFQTLIGIGGALTDAAAETFYKIPAKPQEY